MFVLCVLTQFQASVVKSEQINDRVFALVQAIIDNPNSNNTVTDVSMVIISAKVIRLEAIVSALQAIVKDETNKNLVAAINAQVENVKGMLHNGTTKVFAKHFFNSADVNSLSFVNLAIKSYVTEGINGERVIAGDYLLALYGIQERAGKSCGIASFGSDLFNNLGKAFAVMADRCPEIFTSMTLGLQGASAMSMTVAQHLEKYSHISPKDITRSDMFEANFIYELLQRGYVQLDPNTRELSFK